MVKVAYTFSEYSNDWWTDNVIDNVFENVIVTVKSDINDINASDDALLLVRRHCIPLQYVTLVQQPSCIVPF